MMMMSKPQRLSAKVSVITRPLGGADEEEEEDARVVVVVVGTADSTGCRGFWKRLQNFYGLSANSKKRCGLKYMKAKLNAGEDSSQFVLCFFDDTNGDEDGGIADLSEITKNMERILGASDVNLYYLGGEQFERHLREVELASTESAVVWGVKPKAIIDGLLLLRKKAQQQKKDSDDDDDDDKPLMRMVVGGGGSGGRSSTEEKKELAAANEELKLRLKRTQAELELQRGENRRLRNKHKRLRGMMEPVVAGFDRLRDSIAKQRAALLVDEEDSSDAGGGAGSSDSDQ